MNNGFTLPSCSLQRNSFQLEGASFFMLFTKMYKQQRTSLLTYHVSIPLSDCFLFSLFLLCRLAVPCPRLCPCPCPYPFLGHRHAVAFGILCGHFLIDIQTDISTQRTENSIKKSRTKSTKKVPLFLTFPFSSSLSTSPFLSFSSSPPKATFIITSYPSFSFSSFFGPI